MKLEFLPEARSELIEAYCYYEEREKGLGKRFRDEVRDVSAMILRHPYFWRERHGGFHRVNCPVFPYHIAYFIRSEKVIVAAVAHDSRHPDYWKDRLG